MPSELTAPTTPLILASASPRRRELLVLFGIDHVASSSELDEQSDATSPERLVLELAERKAAAVAPRYPSNYILAADSVVALDGEVFGKPRGPAEAIDTLSSLRGRVHQVMTGVALVDPHERTVRTSYAATRVAMRHSSDAEIAAYVATGEPLDKAGSYAIQGLGGALIDDIEGCYANVIGLPVCVVAGLYLPGVQAIQQALRTSTARNVCARCRQGPTGCLLLAPDER